MKAKRLMAIVLTLAMLITCASFPAFADTTELQVPLEEANVITVPQGQAPRNVKANLVDGDKATSYAINVHNSGLKDVTDNNVFEFDLGAEFDLSKLNLYWGDGSWGNQCPGAYTVEVAGEDKAYTEKLSYTNLLKDGDAFDVLPSSFTADRTYAPQAKVAACESVNWPGVRYIKVTVNQYANRATLAEIEVYANFESVNYTVNHLDEDGTLLDSKTASGVPGQIVTEEAKYFRGYVCTDANTSKDLALSSDPSANVITFNYQSFTETDKAEKLALTGACVIGTPQSLSSGYTDPNALFNGVTVGKDGMAPNHWVATGTVGATQAQNSTFIFDLGDIYDIEELKIDWGSTNTAAWGFCGADTYAIYVSTDNVTYTLAARTEDIVASVFNSTATPDNITYTNTNKSYFSFISTDTGMDGARYVKLVIEKHTGRPLISEVEVVAKKSVVSTNAGTATFSYVDTNGNPIAAALVLADNVGGSVTSAPIEIAGYAYSGTEESVTVPITGRTNTNVVFTYRPIKTVSNLPSEFGETSLNAMAIPFDFVAVTPTNVNPADDFAVANWVVNNCTITSVNVVSADDPATAVYEWNVKVVVKPTNNAIYSFTLDLPDLYELTDAISVTRTPSITKLDSDVVNDDMNIAFEKEEITVTISSGKITTSEADRTVPVTVTLPTIKTDVLPYKGYTNLDFELKDITSAGKGFTYDAKSFVRIGNTYYGEVLATEVGVDRLIFEVALVGVNANGTTTELSTAKIPSKVISVVVPDEVVKTEAETVSGHAFIIDVLDQLIAQVHPSDLPVISDSEWDFYQEVLNARNPSNPASVQTYKDQLELARAATPASDYPSNVVIRAGKSSINARLWNMLKDLHVDSITLVPTSLTQHTEENGNAIESFSITFRNGIDYDQLSYVDADYFVFADARVRGNDAPSGTPDDKKASYYTQAYNSVRRALNDDQLSPIVFRLGWYSWKPLPFTGGVINVTISEKWLDNYGYFNLDVYHTSDYKYSEDNTVAVYEVESDNFVKNPATRTFSFVAQSGKEIYDSYAIVSTNKIPQA